MLTRKEILDHHRRGLAVPLVRRLPADLLTPLGALLRIGGGEAALEARRPASAFLFESVERGERIGRYSYVGLSDLDGEGSIRAFLRPWLKRIAAVPLATELFKGLPRFLGGAVFSIGWDYVREIEPRLGGTPVSSLGMVGDTADIGIFPEIVAFDHVRQEVMVARVLQPGDDVDEAQASLDALARKLEDPLPGLIGKAREPDKKPVIPTLDCAELAARVVRAKEYIAAGDAFQIVLSRRFDRETKASGLAIYRALRMVNPSPYMFWLRLGGRELAGSSPEMLVRVENGEAVTHPIAGTRRRGADEAEDARLAADLLADPKERAEHSMLVDLARNDLGRVAAPGAVRVTRHMEVERFSHVMHLVSEVRAKLAPGVDAVDALEACFPAGTVSGAPKVRAIEIIHELEPTPRGPYAGAVGALSVGGAMDTCITIRTVEKSGGVARWQAGAGIVADSDPAREAEETREKAFAMRAAIDRAEAELMS